MLSPTVRTGGDLKWDEIPLNIGETRRWSPLVIIGHDEASGGGSWTKFELISMRIPVKMGIPTPFPTRGGATIENRPVFTVVLSLF